MQYTDKKFIKTPIYFDRKKCGKIILSNRLIGDKGMNFMNNLLQEEAQRIHGESQKNYFNK